MSWCRWSSLDHACDLYVYEGEAGVVVHVAGRRPVIDRSALGPPVHVLGDSDAYIARHDKLSRLLDDCGYENIGLPHANTSRTFDALTEAADWIDELVALGYVAPVGMTDEMRAAATTEGDKQ